MPTSVQTTVPINAAIGFPGMLYDLSPHDIVTRIATAVIPFGSLVVFTGENCAPVGLTGDVTAGQIAIALRDEDKPSGGSIPLATVGAGYQIGDPVRCLRKGKVWVTPEEGTATAGATVFGRFTVNGALVPGGFRSDVDSGKAVAIPRAQYFTGASTTAGATVAVVEINTP